MLDTVRKQDDRESFDASWSAISDAVALLDARAAKRPVAVNAQHYPDDEVVGAVLTLAARAPSIENTQPWRWRVDRTSLHLYTDSRMLLPNADPDGRDLILSCGAALNHFVIALAAMGWHADVHRLPDPADTSTSPPSRCLHTPPIAPTSRWPQQSRSAEPIGGSTALGRSRRAISPRWLPWPPEWE